MPARCCPVIFACEFRTDTYISHPGHYACCNCLSNPLHGCPPYVFQCTYALYPNLARLVESEIKWVQLRSEWVSEWEEGDRVPIGPLLVHSTTFCLAKHACWGLHDHCLRCVIFLQPLFCICFMIGKLCTALPLLLECSCISCYG